jgi:hypothetical protein
VGSLSHLVPVAIVLLAGAAQAVFGLFAPEQWRAGWLRFRRQRRNALLIWTGIVLISVPTAFTVFPTWGLYWPRWVRETLLGAWFVFACVGVSVSVVSEGSLAKKITQLINVFTSGPEPPPPRQVRAVRQARLDVVGPILLQMVLANPPDVPSGHIFHVYVYDSDTELLTPAWVTPGQAPPQSWEVGRGATGFAWQEGGLVIAQGDAVHNEEFKLTPEEQQRYANIKIVVAVPIHTEDGQPIGVLTGLSESNEVFLATEQGVDALLVMSALVGTLLEAMGTSYT